MTEAKTMFNAAAGMWTVECVDVGGVPVVKLTEPGQAARVVAWSIAAKIADTPLGDPTGDVLMDFFEKMRRLIRRNDGPSMVLAALASAEAEAANATAAAAVA